MEQKETLTEEARANFSPEAFSGLEKLVETVGHVDADETTEPSSLVEETTEVGEAAPEVQAEDDDSDFDWNQESAEEVLEEETPVAEEEIDDWDIEEDNTVVAEEAETERVKEEVPAETNWGEIAEELGLAGDSKEEILESLKQLSSDKPQVSNDKISKYEGFLEMTDRELLSADMKATGMDEFDIDDAIDRMEDSGMLKHESLKIRKQLRTAINGERSAEESKASEAKAATERSQKQAKAELQKHLKGFDSYMGGKVTTEQRKDLYKYITAGDFNKEVYESHANVAEAAFLWKNRKTLSKLLRNQGFEEGKANVLDNLSNRGGRGNSKPKYKAGSGFDAGSFLAD